MKLTSARGAFKVFPEAEIHDHVPICSRSRSQSVGQRRLYSSLEVFEEASRALRKERLIAYLRSLEVKMRAPLLDALAVNLRELQIRIDLETDLVDADDLMEEYHGA